MNTDSATVVSFARENLKLDNAASCKRINESLNSKKNTVETFELSGNTIGIKAAQSLINALSECINMKSLLWHDMFTGRLKSEIRPALEALSDGVIRSNCRLYLIDLSHNAFGPNGIVGVTKLLSSPTCYNLKVLRLDNEGLGHQGCQILVDALERAFSDSAGQFNLQVFSAGRNRLENFGAALLAKLFSKMSALQEVSLPQNGIGIHGDAEFPQLMQALSQHSHLHLLDLSDNSLRPCGVESLAQHLSYWPDLRCLQLNDCLVRSEGCAHLIGQLTANVCPRLEQLHVAGNELRSDDALLLTQALLSNERRAYMLCLDINSNSLGESGVANVRAMAKQLLEESGEDTACRDVNQFFVNGFEDDEGSASEEEKSDEEKSEEEEATTHSLPSQLSRSADISTAALNFSFCKTAQIHDKLPPQQIHDTLTPQQSLFSSSAKETSSAGVDLFRAFTTSSSVSLAQQADALQARSLLVKTVRLFLQSEASFSNKAVLERLAALHEFLISPDLDDQLKIDQMGYSEVEAAVRRCCGLTESNLDGFDPKINSELLIKVVAGLLARIFRTHSLVGPNTFLVELGLIKSEEGRRFKPACSDPTSLLPVASELMREAGKHYHLTAKVTGQLALVIRDFTDKKLKPKLVDCNQKAQLAVLEESVLQSILSLKLSP